MTFFSTLALSIPSPPESVWHIGPVPIRAYALCILSGVILAVWWSGKRYEAREGKAEDIADMAVWAVPIGIIGARLYHVITTPQPYFGANGDPMKAFAIWNGGLGIWGGIALGGFAAWWYCKRHGLSVATIADSIAPTLLVAQAMGRLGNWFNQELYGRPTDLPWGLEIDLAHRRPGYENAETFHPTFLYEAVWNLLGAAFLLWIERRFSINRGRLLWAYVLVYCMGRIWVETVRIDEANRIAGVRLNVWTSLILGVFSVFMIWRISRRRSTVEVNAENS